MRRADLASIDAPNLVGQPVSRILLADGMMSPENLVKALAEAGRTGRNLDYIFEAGALVSPDDLLLAQAKRHGALALRRDTTAPDPTLAGLLPPDYCLKHSILPWLRIGQTLVVATSRPDAFDALLPDLPGDLGPMMMAVAREEDIHTTIAETQGAMLAHQAENWPEAEESCRDLNLSSPRNKLVGAALGLAALMLLIFAPTLLFGAGLALALASLFVAQGLKLLTLFASHHRQKLPDTPQRPKVLPIVSLLVPLFEEERIAQSLLARLGELTYPKALLDVILVLEDKDDQTRRALKAAPLPPWVRVVEVPPGSVLTKPRAMNYALHFARGDIIGVYDAEDAPAPDQIDRVVQSFAAAPPRVACLQGILDFYNPRANWLSRCFAIEYASWFRVLLPGMARLGLALPLGGTTIFFRREALESVRGWDAHNVTEDADLGLRLARRGYRTDLIPTVTREEANNRFWPWVKQRSRWLKGYLITWWVHTRRPRALWQDLGPKRFFGMQALFLGTVLQFTLAPVLWSFWLILFGLPHPLDGVLSDSARTTLIAAFLSAEAVSILVGVVAVSRTRHSGLYPWVPTLFAYFPLGTVAIYKAIWETARRPFYWDKTQHGLSSEDPQEPDP